MTAAFPSHGENQKLASRLGVRRLEDARHFPKFFEVETVNACNARCTMCTINDWEQGENVIMSEALYAKFVDEVGQYADWVETVCLNRDGEPTLDKYLPQRVEMLKEAGIRKVTFATNVQLLVPRLVHQLLDAGLDDIMVSVDGITKATFEAIRVRLNYETVLNNTLNLLRIRNKRGANLTVRMRMVIMDRNRHEVDEWLAFWKAQVSPQDRVYAKPVHTWGNQLGVEADEMVARYADTPCVSPFSTIILQVNGKVPLCGVDYNVKHLMGDFTRQSIKEIWNSELFAQVRWQHANRRRNEIAVCRGCHIWDEDLMVTESIGRTPGQASTVPVAA